MSIYGRITGKTFNRDPEGSARNGCRRSPLQLVEIKSIHRFLRFPQIETMTSTQIICANLENLWMKIVVGFFAHDEHLWKNHGKMLEFSLQAALLWQSDRFEPSPPPRQAAQAEA
jgi:hypothetical protein